MFSVSGPAWEHLSLPGYDHVERPQNDSCWETGGADPAWGSYQPADLHHGGKPDISYVRTIREVRLHSWLSEDLKVLQLIYNFLFCNYREERNQTQVLRQQQDEAYLASLRADQEKDRKKREEQEQKRQEEEKARQSILAEERRRRVSDLQVYIKKNKLF